MLELDCRIVVVGRATSQMGRDHFGFEEIELVGGLGGALVAHRARAPLAGLPPQDEGGAGGGLQLGFVAGVILRERLPAFEKMLWRACRGNVFLRQAEIEDPLEDPQAGDQVFKSVFVIFFQGKRSVLGDGLIPTFRGAAEVAGKEDLRGFPGDPLPVPRPGRRQEGDGRGRDAAA